LQQKFLHLKQKWNDGTMFWEGYEFWSAQLEAEMEAVGERIAPAALYPIQFKLEEVKGDVFPF
jgi:hypothetical protein